MDELDYDAWPELDAIEAPYDDRMDHHTRFGAHLCANAARLLTLSREQVNSSRRLLEAPVKRPTTLIEE